MKKKTQSPGFGGMILKLFFFFSPPIKNMNTEGARDNINLNFNHLLSYK